MSEPHAYLREPSRSMLKKHDEHAAACPTTQIATHPFVKSFVYLDECESTNTYAVQIAPRIRLPSDGIGVVWALRQSMGKGRQGRSFFSSVDGGLWVSLIVRIKCIDEHFSVNRALSLAICDTLTATTGGIPAIKWPNDIYWGDKKICGILLESTSNTPPCIVAGFGLNVNIHRLQFPEELRCIATSVQIETGKSYSLSDMLENILTVFDKRRSMPDIPNHDAYQKRLYGIGKSIRIEGEEGILESVQEEGSLVLRQGTNLRYMHSGTVEFLS